MQTIDIKQLIEDKALDFNEVCRQLFPSNKYPRLALNRVIANEAVLDANQISKLAMLSGVSIEELYGTEGWKSIIDDDIVVLTNKDFKAEFNTKTSTTKIFDKESLFHEFVLHQPAISLKDYVVLLNNEITKNRKK